MSNRTKKLLMLCILLLGCAITAFWNYSGEKKDGGNTVNQLIAASKENAKYQESRYIKIYVSGAVLMPGIYDVPFGARAYDAVAAAGGMTNEADADRVNLAKKLKDGDHVNVAFVKSSRTRSNKSTKTKDSTRSIAAENDNSVGLININTASQSELDSLPGIGPAMAKRIVTEREKAPFTSVDDLLRVKGIGPAKLNKLRSRVKVN